MYNTPYIWYKLPSDICGSLGEREEKRMDKGGRVCLFYFFLSLSLSSSDYWLINWLIDFFFVFFCICKKLAPYLHQPTPPVHTYMYIPTIHFCNSHSPHSNHAITLSYLESGSWAQVCYVNVYVLYIHTFTYVTTHDTSPGGGSGFSQTAIKSLYVSTYGHLSYVSYHIFLAVQAGKCFPALR